MDFTSRSVHLMGTTISISILHHQADLLLDKVVHLLFLYEKRFSANDDTSELMKINHQAGKNWVQVHPELFELIELGKKHSLARKSHLNITIGPLVQTWRIGFPDAKIPSTEEIKHCLSLIDPTSIKLDAASSSVFLAEKGMKIDLGAVAKGYIADKVIEFVRNEGVTSALINLGGNVLTLGGNEVSKRSWRIGIQHPKLRRGHNVAILPIVNQSVVTSGIYERTLEKQGQSYHHILDSKTGYPVETDVASLTIVSNRSVDGEIWTTRLFGETPTSILEQVEKEEEIEALGITKDDQLFYTSGLEPELLF